MSKLPETLRRQCCYGKSCGNTDLELTTSTERDETGQFVTYYNYVRQSNGEYYSGWLIETDMIDWVERTKDDLNPEPGEAVQS